MRARRAMADLDERARTSRPSLSGESGVRALPTMHQAKEALAT